MNKNNLIILLLLLIIGIAPSCSKDYLETTPTNKSSSERTFATTESMLVALNGIHRLMYYAHYSDQAMGGQSANMIYMDMMGEDLVNTAAGNGWFNSPYKWEEHRNARGSSVYNNYAFYYEVIGNANQIVANIDKATGPDQDKKLIKGGAFAYRGWSYFQMVQLYGKRYVANGDNSGLGVSLILTPEVQYKPRNTVEEVYKQINSDLDSAIALLADGTARPNKSFHDVKVAKGLKARVALAQGQYALAAQLASEARAGYQPMSQSAILEGFNNITNPEWMWGLAQQADQTTYFYSFYAYMGNFSSTNTRTNPKAINSKLYNSMEATDIRRKLWDPTGTNTSFPVAQNGVRRPYMSGKFLIKPEGGGISIGDLPFMRAAEMYLLEAEARARAGENDKAATVLFELISKRDPAYVKSTKVGEELIKEIMKHRRIELWGEGFRFYDLKRTNSDLDRTDANHNAALAGVLKVPAGDKLWQFLIPEAEINASNKIIVQNEL